MKNAFKKIIVSVKTNVVNFGKYGPVQIMFSRLLLGKGRQCLSKTFREAFKNLI